MKQVPIPERRRGRPKETPAQKKRKAVEKTLGRKLTETEWKALQAKEDPETVNVEEMMAKVAKAQSEYQANILPPETKPEGFKGEPGEDDPAGYEARQMAQIQAALERSRGTMMNSLKPPTSTKKEVGDHEEIFLSRAKEPSIEDEPTGRKPQFVRDDEVGFTEVP